LGVKFDRFWGSYEKVGTHLGNAARQYAESERLAARVREQFGTILEDRGPEAPDAAPSDAARSDADGGARGAGVVARETPAVAAPAVLSAALSAARSAGPVAPVAPLPVA
jgi:hypothetical protein